MSRIGILAYGSLIEDPGKEIEPLINRRREKIETPFSVEFARSSSKRDGAPTIVSVESGGSPVWGRSRGRWAVKGTFYSNSVKPKRCSLKIK